MSDVTAPHKIAHLGVAVRDLDAALSFYRDRLGLRVAEILDLPERGLRIAMLPLGEAILELMEPTRGDSQISRFLETRGPGLHHLCLGVEGIQGKLDDLDRQGVRLLTRTPELGAEGYPVAFVHPKATGGVLLELLDDSGGAASE